jgi:hypothetical protein
LDLLLRQHFLEEDLREEYYLLLLQLHLYNLLHHQNHLDYQLHHPAHRHQQHLQQ